MDSWVAPHLTGGIGNRFFELAAALGAAEKWNLPCVILKSAIGDNSHGPTDNILKLYPNLKGVETREPVFKIPEANGECFRYNAFPSDPPAKKVLIEGWRQTYKYFPKDQSLLVPSWSSLLSAEKQEALLQKYELTLGKKFTTWFLHIRLGDYKVLPHHQIPVIPYYEKCLDQVPKDHTVLLFSDEPHLCSQWFEAQCQKRGLKSNIVQEEEIPTLFLMSRCWGGAIVANSTFSWWGAYFAKLQMPSDTPYRAFYPSVWGQGLPPAYEINPPWGTTIQIQ